MSLKTHLANHWHHYSLGGILIWSCSKMDVIWDKTQWIRDIFGWVKPKKKKKRRTRK